jgi:signal peptidase I
MKPIEPIGPIEQGFPNISQPMRPSEPIEQATGSLLYKGPSMNPVLKSPDILHVRPYGRSRIRCGDVVVFRALDGDCKVVHRVVSVDGNEFRTKGDNNWHLDSWALKPEDVIGRVEWIDREGKRIRIYGGLIGRVQADALKAGRLLSSGVRFVLRPLYRRLSQSRVLKQWFAGRMATRIISLERAEGTELQLLLGRRVIGRRPAGRRYWHIRHPFLLVVDEESLPQVPER